MCDRRTRRTSWSTSFSRFFACDRIAARIVRRGFCIDIRLTRACKVTLRMIVRIIVPARSQRSCNHPSGAVNIGNVRIQLVQLPRTQQRRSKKDCVLPFFRHESLPQIGRGQRWGANCISRMVHTSAVTSFIRLGPSQSLCFL
jgi:hypothetical protein